MKTAEMTRITKAEVLEIVGLKGGTIVESTMPSSSAWFFVRCEGFKVYKGKSYPSEYEKDMLYNGNQLLGCYTENDLSTVFRTGTFSSIGSFITSGLCIPSVKEKKLLDRAVATFLDKTAMNT